MPKVMQDQFKKPSGSRSFSTSARSRMPDVENASSDAASAAMLADMIQQVNGQAVERNSGLKFDVPANPAKTLNFRKRYDSVQDQFTKMMMQDGKLARAQRVCHSNIVVAQHELIICRHRTCLLSWITFAPHPLLIRTRAVPSWALRQQLNCLSTLPSTFH